MTQPPNSPAPKKPQDHQNGHTVILKTLIRDKTPVEMELMNGECVVGNITQFDNYTITMRVHTLDAHRTFFKHAIVCFGAE